MVNDTVFREGVYTLKELGHYYDALCIFEKLAETGDPRADEMIKETKYELAYHKAELEMWISSYELFNEIADYKDSLDAISILRDILYEEGKSAYYEGEYLQAIKYFAPIVSYADTINYLTLIDCLRYRYGSSAFAHWWAETALNDIAGFKMVSSAEEAMEKLLSLTEFENAGNILIDYFGYTYLLGKWRTNDASYYFQMTEDHYASYNLPRFDYGDYYRLENGDYLLYPDGHEDESRAMFHFYPITSTCMQVYCYKDGSFYTLYKQ